MQYRINAGMNIIGGMFGPQDRPGFGWYDVAECARVHGAVISEADAMRAAARAARLLFGKTVRVQRQGSDLSFQALRGKGENLKLYGWPFELREIE